MYMLHSQSHLSTHMWDQAQIRYLPSESTADALKLEGVVQRCLVLHSQNHLALGHIIILRPYWT